MKLLLVEDEIAMSEAVCDILNYHKYMVDCVYNGKDAVEYALHGDYDGIVMDIMMPVMDGLSALKKIRDAGCSVPVLLLTAKSEIEDRILGLDTGADDYLPKPFAMGELLARIRAMLRRRENYTPDKIAFGNLSLDQSRGELSVGENAVSLSKLEYRLMEHFMNNPGISFSPEALLERIWGMNSDAEIGSVWVYISYLRKKMAQLSADVEILSRRGVGYSLEVRK